MRNRWRWVAGTALGAAFMAAALAPFPLLLLPNPAPVPVKGPLLEAQPGVYLATPSGTFRVFPRAEEAQDFPADALRTRGPVTVAVRARQLDSMEAYSLTTFAGQAPVATSKDSEANRLLTMKPLAPLPAGRYCVTVSRDGLYGGTDFVYFEVTPSASTAAPRAPAPVTARRASRQGG